MRSYRHRKSRPRGGSPVSLVIRGIPDSPVSSLDILIIPDTLVSLASLTIRRSLSPNRSPSLSRLSLSRPSRPRR